jgi:hypothetical protein
MWHRECRAAVYTHDSIVNLHVEPRVRHRAHNGLRCGQQSQIELLSRRNSVEAPGIEARVRRASFAV